MTSIFVVPDPQVKPGVSLDYLKWIGHYIVAKKPDIIVCLGDFADMPSLSIYDKGKLQFEGRRYKEDIKSVQEGMNILLAPLKEYNKKAAEGHRARYKPRLVMTLGNHEERIKRVAENSPEFEGLISYADLEYEKHGWEVHDYLKPVDIEGTLFVHYLANPMSGKPLSGTALNQLKQVGKSFIVGHKQTLDVATRFILDGTQQWGIVAGACLTPDHKVLTADLKYVELGNVKIGDKLTSFDEFSTDSSGRSRRFKTGTVTNVAKAVKPVWKVTLQSGKVFKVTEDHLWLTKLGTSLLWKTTAQLRKGSRIPKVFDEWDTATSYEAGWLAGMYDGEGCYYTRQTTGGTCAQLGVTQKEGPVLERLKTALADLVGVEHTGVTRDSDSCATLRIKGGTRNIARVLGTLRPLRLLAKFLPEHLARMVTSEAQVDSVVSKELVGEQEIVQIGIDAGTMIVEGYPHHNCYPHDEAYKGYQGNPHWRGCLMLHRAKAGNFDPLIISLDFLKERYERETK